MTRTQPLSASGVMRRPEMWFSGTHSAQTVCQRPLCGVYQMPPRFLRCLPRGRVDASESSRTRTTSVFSSASASVASAVKAV